MEGEKKNSHQLSTSKQVALYGTMGFGTLFITELIKRPLILAHFDQIYEHKGKIGYFQSLKNIFQNGGYSNIWKKFNFDVITKNFGVPLNFTFYNILDNKFEKKHEYLQGGLSSLLSTTLMYPMNRMVPQKDSHKLGNGLARFYNGFFSTLPSIVLFRSLYFGGYYHLKTIYNIDKNFHFFKSLLIAQSVTFCSYIVCIPLQKVNELNFKEKKPFFEQLQNVIKNESFGFKKFHKNRIQFITMFFSGLQLVIFDLFMKIFK